MDDIIKSLKYVLESLRTPSGTETDSFKILGLTIIALQTLNDKNQTNYLAFPPVKRSQTPYRFAPSILKSDSTHTHNS